MDKKEIILESANVNPETTLMMAVALYHNGGYKEAAAMFNQILKNEPNNDDAWHYLGVIYWKQKRDEDAKNCMRKSRLKKSCKALAAMTWGEEGC